jgi:hypothetical protein
MDQPEPEDTRNMAMSDKRKLEKLLKVVSSSWPSLTYVNMRVPTAEKMKITMKVKTTEAKACGALLVMVSSRPTKVWILVSNLNRRNIPAIQLISPHVPYKTSARMEVEQKVCIFKRNPSPQHADRGIEAELT